MTLETIRNIVKDTFRATFIESECEYSLKELVDNKADHISYIIYDDSGIVCEFWVSDYIIYDAIIKGDLATSKLDLAVWSYFMVRVNEKLREANNG